jgi:cytochrome c peroxidase
MSLSEDGNELFIAISGTHELIRLSLPSMLEKIQKTALSDMANNLTFLNNDKTRIPLTGKGARHVLMYNKKAFVSEYFSAGLSVVDMDTQNKRFIRLGNEPVPDEIRRGEQYFEDADICFQHWQSCTSCHPDARSDGLNWDLINDGLGNPKNSKSLLYAHFTPPCMITGIRPNAEVAVRAGIRYIQFSERPEEDAVCMDKYLRSLAALPSPYLENGKLSKTAQKGKKIFEQAGCLNCHSGDYFTNGQKYDVGTGIEEYKQVSFDTPTLREIWRTAPYLYNGGAKTIKEVITTFNKNNQHGVTSKLTDKEIGALEQYILSL